MQLPLPPPSDVAPGPVEPISFCVVYLLFLSLALLVLPKKWMRRLIQIAVPHAGRKMNRVADKYGFGLVNFIVSRIEDDYH